MTKRHATVLLTVGALLAALALPAAPASANHTGNFTCRAAPLRITAPVVGRFEPVVANPNQNPCQDDFDQLLGVGPIAGISAGILTAQTVTEEHEFAQASSEVLGARIETAGQLITVSVLGSNARATCPESGGEAVFTGGSHVAQLFIRGVTPQPITVAFPANTTITLPAGAGVIVLNEQTTTTDAQGNRVFTVRALHVTLLGGTVDAVFAESIVDVHGDACDNQPPEARHPGWMTGGGFVAEEGSKQNHTPGGTVDPGMVAHHSFSIDCFFPTGDDPGKKDHLNVRWTDDDGRERASFKAEVILDARCFDRGDPENPRSTFNHIEGEAVGICRTPGGGTFPAEARFEFDDNGEPGRNDFADVQVSPIVGTDAEDDAAPPEICGLDYEGNLDGGNHQAHQTAKQREQAP